MQGFILKQSEYMKFWNIRYFVLQQGSLAYFDKAHPQPPYGENKRGGIGDLGTTKIKVDNAKSLLILTADDGKKITLRIEDPNELQVWANSIQVNYAHHAFYSAK